LKGSWP